MADWSLLLEAYGLVACCSAATSLLPFLRLGALASLELGKRSRDDAPRLVERVRWAVMASARRSPWRAVCFQQGLAAQIMLRRRGLSSTLYFGAAPDPAKGLVAHVWVRLGELPVVGCEEAPRFPVLASFPASAPASV